MDHSLISLMTFFITVSQNKEFFSASSIIKILGIFLIVVLVENSYTDHLRIVTYCLKDTVTIIKKPRTSEVSSMEAPDLSSTTLWGFLVVGGGGLGSVLQHVLGSVALVLSGQQNWP